MTRMTLRMNMLLYRDVIRTRKKGHVHCSYGIAIWVFYHMMVDQMLSQNLSVKYQLIAGEDPTGPEALLAASAVNLSYSNSNTSSNKISTYCDLFSIAPVEHILETAREVAALRNIIYHPSIHRSRPGYFPAPADAILERAGLGRSVDGSYPAWLDRLCRPDVIDWLSSFMDHVLIPSLKTYIPFGDPPSNLCLFSNYATDDVFAVAHIREMEERGVLATGTYARNRLSDWSAFPSRSNLSSKL